MKLLQSLDLVVGGRYSKKHLLGLTQFNIVTLTLISILTLWVEQN